MRYNLNKIKERCEEIGISSTMRSPEELAIELAEGVVLRFYSSEKGGDGIVQFEGTPWHSHGDLTFADSHGYETEISFMDVVTRLAEGSILVCEKWSRGELVNRWLDHQDYIGPFRYMKEGDEVRIWRIARQDPASSS
jgi:hypothetical protein